MNLWEKQVMFTRMLSDLLDFATKMGFMVALREVARSAEQQAIYIREGKSKTSNSRHLLCLAADLVMFDADGVMVVSGMDHRWKVLGLRWEQMGGRWGGRFGDDPKTPIIEGWDAGHFEVVP